jgi:type IV pilus assembly protein PilQ
VGVKEALTSQVGIVGGVLTQNFKSETDLMTRLSVSLVKQATYRVRADNTSLKIILTPTTTTGAASTADIKTTNKNISSAETSDITELSDVRFKKNKNGADRVLITTTAVPAYSLDTSPDGRMRLKLKKTQLPKALAKTVDLASQHNPLKSVSTFYDASSESTIIKIDREGMAQNSIAVDGKSIIWAFDAPKISATGAKAPSRKSVTIAHKRIEKNNPKIETSIHNNETAAPDASASGDVKIEIDGATETAGFAATLNTSSTNSQGLFSHKLG